MLALGCKMLLRRRGTALSIIAIALLVAIVASTNSIINYIDLQVQALGRLISPGRTYLILSRDATSIMDSRVDAEVARKLGSLRYVENVLPQKMLTATITKGSDSRAVHVRGVEDVGGFLKAGRAYVNGTTAESWMEANVGEVLARALSISLGDEVSLAVGDRQVKVRVVGVFRSQAQSDAELVVPMETANRLAGNDDTVSFIEFAFKEGVNSLEAVNQVTQLLPENVKLVQVQQIMKFRRVPLQLKGAEDI